MAFYKNLRVLMWHCVWKSNFVNSNQFFVQKKDFGGKVAFYFNSNLVAFWSRVVLYLPWIYLFLNFKEMFLCGSTRFVMVSNSNSLLMEAFCKNLFGLCIHLLSLHYIVSKNNNGGQGNPYQIKEMFFV